MNRDQLDLIPDHLLKPRKDGLRQLIEWLHVRGWRMSLAELETERRDRDIRSAR